LQDRSRLLCPRQANWARERRETPPVLSGLSASDGGRSAWLRGNASACRRTRIGTEVVGDGVRAKRRRDSRCYGRNDGNGWTWIADPLLGECLEIARLRPNGGFPDVTVGIGSRNVRAVVGRRRPRRCSRRNNQAEQCGTKCGNDHAPQRRARSPSPLMPACVHEWPVSVHI
jgi:hypothetical protein